MGLWAGIKRRIVGAPTPAIEDVPAQNIAFQESFWGSLGVGQDTLSGEVVNWRTALHVPTLLRAGLVIADGVSTIPCKLMRKDAATGKRTESDDLPLSELLSFEPNDWMDPLELFETMVLHTLFSPHGAAFVFKNKVRGQIVELIPIEPHRVCVEQKDDYRLIYKIIGLDGSEQEFPQETIWHFRGPSWNGWQGLNLINLGREAIGLSMATQNAHARRFGRGVQTTGVYSFEGELDEDQYKRLRAWIDANHAGSVNSGKPMILDRNGKWTGTGLTGVDAQHVETRRLQIEEDCRVIGVNPIMVYHSDKAATYASAEQMFLSHAVHTIRPWHRRFEKSMQRNLLTREQHRAGYYFKFFDAELLRGAAKDRGEYYWKMFQMGMSPNAIFALDDMDGFEGGDNHFVPSTMMTVENAAMTRGIGDNGGPPLNEDDPDEATEAARRNARTIMNVGRVLSSENEGKIRDARDKLDTVLAKLDQQQEE